MDISRVEKNFLLVDEKFKKLFNIIQRVEDNNKNFELTILSLDDDDDIINLFYKKYFRKYSNIRHIYADNYRDFKLFKKEYNIDIFIIDILMPDINGIEVASKLRKSDKIIISSAVTGDYINEIKLLKVTHPNIVWINKHYSEKILYDTVMTLWLHNKN